MLEEEEKGENEGGKEGRWRWREERLYIPRDDIGENRQEKVMEEKGKGEIWGDMGKGC